MEYAASSIIERPARRSPSELRKVFGTNLRQLAARETSVSQLCRDLGINRTQFNRYLVGEAFPRPDVLDQICNHFDVDARILLEPLDRLEQERFGADILAQLPFLEALQATGAISRDRDMTPDGYYMMYRRSIFHRDHLTAYPMRITSTQSGPSRLRATLPRSMAQRTDVGDSFEQRRIEGLVFQHMNGISFVTIVAHAPVLHFGFLSNAYRGNPRYFHGASIITQSYLARGRHFEPVLLERVEEPGRNGLWPYRRVIGMRSLALHAPFVRDYFEEADVGG